jgi:hypothetical protein
MLLSFSHILEPEIYANPFDYLEAAIPRAAVFS